jgi:hypothetical protein
VLTAYDVELKRLEKLRAEKAGMLLQDARERLRPLWKVRAHTGAGSSASWD